jgi:hypothetical protein
VKTGNQVGEREEMEKHRTCTTGNFRDLVLGGVRPASELGTYANRIAAADAEAAHREALNVPAPLINALVMAMGI